MPPLQKPPDPQDIDLGPCCICQETNPTVRNLITLPYRDPNDDSPTGWGCLLCNLPPNGTTAVICDNCMAKHGNKDLKSQLKHVIHGYPALHGRKPFQPDLLEPFDHNLELHE